MLAAGLEPVREASLGGVLSSLETGLGLTATARRSGPGERLERVLLDAAREEGTVLVVCLGPGCDAATFTVAPVEPTVRFVVVPADGGERNVAGVTFAIDEAAYIAGAVAGALGPGAEVVLVDGPGCGSAVREGLENGLRSRDRTGTLREISRADLLAGRATVSGAAMAVLCPGPEGDRIATALADSGAIVTTFDPAVADRLDGAPCAVIEVDLAEAVLRAARDLVERDVAGRAYTFDVGSGVVRFRFCGRCRDRLPPDALEAAREATDEVTAGIAEIEELDRQE